MRERPLTEFISEKGTKEKKKPEKPKGLKGPWELPEGWRWVRLGNLLKEPVQNGYSPQPAENPTGVWILSLSALSTIEIEDDTPHLKPAPLENKIREFFLQSGDILVSRANTKELVGLSSIYTGNQRDVIFPDLMMRIRVNEEVVDKKFLVYWLRSPYSRQYFASNAKGTSQSMAKINQRTLIKTPVPLPSLSKQKRIVAKLDELNKRIEEAKRLAREAREEAERLMASALHEVFSKAEERGWEWVKIKDIATDTERVNPTKTPNLEFWYIDIASIDNATYQISKPKLLKGKEAPSRARKLVKAGDVIFATTRPYLKNVAIVPDWLDNQVCSTGFAVLRANPEKTIPQWMFYYLVSDFAIEKIKPMMRGANYPAITDRDLFNLKIPLPPLEEQKRIVAYLDSIHEHAQRLVQLYEEREKELKKLFPAVLDRAFRGEL
ncbi:restriction endonuclease subunit S [Thermococcus sp. 21S7]|uniref:restriction endonuclease subunit S n=1 Tax=Thermococcus sp. 21S7 TaxID=1638221 RepID=UPI00143B8B0C|nr:restriction endonuclease subunit S [Thermococcus sp. 21S7]NJE62452.1 restriction endonuclease subunit S [Thermococcus sp. 21S7]